MLTQIWFLLLIFLATTAKAQVRIIQYSDSHSSLRSLAKQIKAIDMYCQEYVDLEPEGECIVLVLGDHAEIHPFTMDHMGQTSLEALKILKQRGHTVLYTPGNHDAFDFHSEEVNGVELMASQIQWLKTLGIPTILGNLSQPTKAMASLVMPYYPLKTLSETTLLVSMTLPQLFQSSQITNEDAAPFFNGTLVPETALAVLWPELESEGIKNLILGSHLGNGRLQKSVEQIHNFFKDQEINDVKFPLAMAAHDHQVTKYREGETVISDAGSHGSFSVIDLDKDGSLKKPIINVQLEERAIATEANADSKLFEIAQNPVNRLVLNLDAELTEFNRVCQAQWRSSKADAENPNHVPNCAEALSTK